MVLNMHDGTRRGLQMLAAAAIATGVTATAVARQDADDSVAEQIQTMREEMAALRRDNERLGQELDELRAETRDDWLTERRAEEIRALVTEVLDDADARAGALQGGLAAGWSEHFFLASPDGRFKLQLDGHMQLRWVYNFQERQDRHQYGFENTRSKLTLSGHVFNPNLTFLLRTDATRNEPGLVNGLFFVRDAWIRYQYDNEWSVRFGQFKLPFNREELVSSAYQLAVERSLVNESVNIGRSQGVEITHATDTGKIMFAYSDGGVDSLGGFGSIVGGNPVNTAALNMDTEFALSARAEWLVAGDWTQFRDFTSPVDDEFGLLLGGGAHWQKGESGTGFGSRRNEVRWVTLTADASVEWGGANAFGSFTWSYADNPNFGQITVWGIVLQGGVYFTPKVEVFARWEYGWWDIRNSTFADLNLITTGVNYYLDGHDVKWTTDIGFGIGRVAGSWDSDLAGWQTDFGDEPQVVFRTQFQLLF